MCQCEDFKIVDNITSSSFVTLEMEGHVEYIELWDFSLQILSFLCYSLHHPGISCIYKLFAYCVV